MKDLRLDKRFGVQFSYLLDCVDTEIIGENATDKEKINFVFDTFNDEYGNAYNKRTYPSECERLANYLRCLPSCCSIAFADYDIIQIGKSWGYCKTPKQEDNFVNNWWNCCAARLIQMRKLLNK